MDTFCDETSPTSGIGVSAVDTVALSALQVGDVATIRMLTGAHDAGDREVGLRLLEIGFGPGERLRVVAAGRPGNEPLAVRLLAGVAGGSATGATFALRRREADLVRVVVDRSGQQ